MAQSFSFSVLQANPDRRRGERVNVGIVVFLPDRLDVRLPESRKMRALTGHSCDDLTQAYAAQIARAYEKDRTPERLVKSIDFMSEIFVPSELGSFAVNAGSDYEKRIASILDNLVNRPRAARRERQQRINSEISRILKKAELLAARGETIEDHKVVPRFVVSPAKDVVADYGYRNGELKVVSTLDMRTLKSLHTKACEKGATLYFAKEEFGSDVKTFGVYAVNPLETDAHRSEIEIMRSFADGHAFNWLDTSQRGKFLSMLASDRFVTAAFPLRVASGRRFVLDPAGLHGDEGPTRDDTKVALPAPRKKGDPTGGKKG
jgi:hypothetical protein